MRTKKSVTVLAAVVAWTVIILAVVPYGVYMIWGGEESTDKNSTEERILRNDDLVAVKGKDGKVSIKDVKTGETTIHSIDLDWKQECGEDSLAVFCSDGKRGYYNMYTGRIAINAQYHRAWVFSEDVAAVEKNGMIGFIDHAGNTVIEFRYPFHGNRLSSFVFKHGHCVVANTKGKCGVIDHRGKWVIAPEYDSISTFEDYVIVGKKGLRMQIDYAGRVLNSFVVDDIVALKYVVTQRVKDEDGYTNEIVKEEKDTGLLVYRVGNRSGLMDASCRRITEPLYLEIEALNARVFKATLPDGYSMVAIDREGNLMR